MKAAVLTAQSSRRHQTIPQPGGSNEDTDPVAANSTASGILTFPRAPTVWAFIVYPHPPGSLDREDLTLDLSGGRSAAPIL